MTRPDYKRFCRIWIAASTHPSKETSAVTNLEHQGFESYCPMLSKRVSHARKRRDVLRPLFPGYVFIRVDPKTQSWRPILSTTGIRLLVRFGDQFGVLPDGFVEGLRARERDGAVRSLCDAHRYSPGESIRVAQGALEGLLATVLSVQENQRLLVLMQILNRKVQVQVPTAVVIPA